MDRVEVLKRVFGHDAFRDGQDSLIDGLLNGRDVLGVMPTGAGKSICYQLPGLMLDGVTLVISPLISLMKDQVMSLKASGVAAAYINSSLTPWQQGEAIRRAANGAYQIIYVAPERLDTPQFMDFVRGARVSLLAVDEAHCVSQWGQDFRPSYLRIADFVDRLPSRPPVGAFTATATRQVRSDIIKLLRLKEPICVATGYNRPNLHFSCVKPTNKFAMLCAFLETMGEESGIVYCATRKAVEEVTDKLKLAGYSAARYHAGLTDLERRTSQDDFQFDRTRVMVATNAFGMGIDKSNVRFVVHYNMPMNLESYYQEAGRAGRDGAPAECLLLYSGQDVITARWMLEHAEENPELTGEQREEIRARDLERLRQMTFYATSKTCLRRFLLRYFDEYGAPEQCGNCSVCDGDAFEVENGRARRPSAAQEREARREERQIAKAQRQIARRSAESDLTSWEAALFENLKALRGLLAARRHTPAYTIFSDASLYDMVKKRPETPDAFLDISGVGLAKQERYGELFLSVIRDGREPNEALEAFDAKPRGRPAKTARKDPGAADRPNGLEAAGKPWTREEEAELRDEFEREVPMEEIARRHHRKPGGILARLRRMGLTE